MDLGPVELHLQAWSGVVRQMPDLLRVLVSNEFAQMCYKSGGTGVWNLMLLVILSVSFLHE